MQPATTRFSGIGFLLVVPLRTLNTLTSISATQQEFEQIHNTQALVSHSPLGVCQQKLFGFSTMPGERRNLRSSKETSSSTNGEEPRSNSQSASSNKDKPVPTRATSSKGKTLPTKKTSGKEASEDKPQTNGTEPVGNGINGAEDVDMVDDGPEKVKVGTSNEGEDEMTVVVPPPKSSKLSGEPGKDDEGDVAMGNTDKSDVVSPELDPKAKAVAGKRLRQLQSLGEFAQNFMTDGLIILSQTSKQTSRC